MAQVSTGWRKSVVVVVSVGALWTCACSGDTDGDPNVGQAGTSAGNGGSAGFGGDAGAAGMAGFGGVGGTAGTAGFGGDAGAAGMAGFGGVGSTGGSGGTIDIDDHGVGDGRDVIAIGDSWMNLGGVGIQQSLLKASGNRPYRPYGVPGTRLLDNVIPNQYRQARTEDPDIKTVVMTGGGNDILQNPAVLLDCFDAGSLCRDTIDRITEGYQALFDEMAADGVEDVIVVNYGRGTTLGPAPIEYVYENLAPLCDDAVVRCHLVDPDEVAGMTMQLRDGIHPTDANYDLLGEHIYDLMVSEGLRR